MRLFPRCLYIFCRKNDPELMHYGRVFADDTKEYVFAEVKKCRYCNKLISRPMEKEEIFEFKRKEGFDFWKLRG